MIKNELPLSVHPATSAEVGCQIGAAFGALTAAKMFFQGYLALKCKVWPCLVGVCTGLASNLLALAPNLKH